jgi:L,D-transpeptidase catalytic domain
MRRVNSRGRLRELAKSECVNQLLIIATLSFAVGQAFAKDVAKASAVPAVLARESTKRELVVSLPDRKLAVIENGEVVKVYPVAVGARNTPSPHGRFEIVNRITNPTYYHKGVVIGPGRANPLGNRWMGMDLRGYGIHGTNVPSSIGKAASHGCIRMRKRDVEELFNSVRVGDIVEIRRERSAELAAVFHSDSAIGAEVRTAAPTKALSPQVMAAMAGEF